MELDAPRAFGRWLTDHRSALGDVLEHGTWLDRDDVEALLDLSLPGVDELVGMLQIVRLASRPQIERKGRRDRLALRSSRSLRSPQPYDIVVVDTAPTGHTLRLLASPQTVVAMAGVLDALQEQHRLIREQLARVARPEAADRLITLVAEQASQTSALLRDHARTTFHWVTLPEPLSVAETEDGVATLERAGLHVSEIVINRVLPDGAPCPICDRRRSGERTAIQAIRRRLGRGRRVRLVEGDRDEPTGVAALARIGRTLVSGEATGKLSRSAFQRKARNTLRGGAFSIASGAATVPPEELDVFRRAKLLFIGGKGGVGKTTVAAAAALRLARADGSRRVLLLSTDPAHSVADALAAAPGAIGDEPQPVRGAPRNLFVRELDAAKALAARRRDLEQALEEIATAVGAEALGGDAAGSAAHLIDLAPPGIDELFGMLTVVDAQDDYELIVVDTAPTGHALRLLELPDVAREWVKVLLRVLLKYQTLVRPGHLAAELVDMSKSIRELQAVLRDPSRTRFLVVTRAAEVPRVETERLLDRLRRLKLATPAVILNAMTLNPGACSWCRAAAAGERRPVEALRHRCRRRLHECVIIQTPLAAPPPRGVRTLDQWAGRWVVDEGSADRQVWPGRQA